MCSLFFGSRPIKLHLQAWEPIFVKAHEWDEGGRIGQEKMEMINFLWSLSQGRLWCFSAGYEAERLVRCLKTYVPVKIIGQNLSLITTH